MFRRIIEIIRQALKRMTIYEGISDIIDQADVYTVSEKMQASLDLWEKMYQDESPWLNEDKGVYSLGLAPLMCSSIASNMLNELRSNVVEPGQQLQEIDESKISGVNSRATYLNNIYHKNLLKHLKGKLEHALAVGGMVIKPYISNGTIYYDFCMQGEFVPLAFTDDGYISDIAFYDDFIDGDKRYRKVERHIWDVASNQVTILNTAYVAKVEDVNNKGIELGNQIPLSQIPRWKNISEEPITVENVEKPLYGYFRFVKENNVDTNSPLGISLFSRGAKMMKRADIQFSRLDWEYEGGQMAVDVDVTATDLNKHSNRYETNQLRERLYRRIDVGSDDTYNVFAPQLRDGQYINGLNTYLMRIEDICEVSRGTISLPQTEARTATELKILQQRSYNTIRNNQEELGKCLDDVIYATNVWVDLANLYNQGEYNTVHDWNDGVIVDMETELNQKLMLLSQNVLGREEVRAWYCGEDLETAGKKVEEIIQKEKENNQLDDIFTDNTDKTHIEQSTLEGGTEIKDIDNPPKQE